MSNKIKRSVYVEARLWFDKSGGNTYHSVRIWVDGEAVRRVGMTYGYGNQFEQTALEALAELGYVSGENSLWHESNAGELFDYYTSESWVLKRELFKDTPAWIDATV